ncbi:MAG: Aromatic amino acid beta-eliminating lyase/threonine aldolase [candidate division Zixibacteria bacterium RBG-1]|nr:MAG: Aromatic amino acid beta-eliminating lyase/threonine aldolase [candidate division Zixibacteria bacterium RBG-1]OGC86693.1 MAG: tyrosine phenol-lyase [candidate division Zixibacteria bacterium RBG_19FT_COMBO_42_43]
MKALVEPYKIKTVESIKLLSYPEREQRLKQAHFNLFNLKSEDVFIDLLTDSGTSAMSDSQWSALMLGDEAYAGAKSYYKLEKIVQEIFGYKHVIPVHQGRAGEHLFFTTVLKKGDYVPSNTHFDTTRANISYVGGIPVDLVIQTKDCEHPFKGNIDLGKLDDLIKKVGKEKIPLGTLTITNNSVGGQPVSMQNIKETKELLSTYGIPLYFDACRFAENAYFIKKREKGYENKTIKEICQELFSYGEGCIMSAKKDGLANMGGFFACNDATLVDKVTHLLVLFEGFRTYGGLAGRDLEAVARGLQEVLDEDYLAFRVNQVKYLGDQLDKLGVPIVKPTGGHAVFVDGGEMLSHIKKENYPAQALTCSLYKEGGVRSVEVGGLMLSRKDKESGKMIFPDADLVRLAIPRRVYTNSHMDYVASVFEEVKKKKGKVKGLKLVYEAPWLRHFTAKLEEV